MKLLKTSDELISHMKIKGIYSGSIVYSGSIEPL